MLDALEGADCSPRQNGAGWQSRCPGHDDKVPSLSISLGDDGRVLLKDHAGCSVEQIVKPLGLTVRDLFATRPNGQTNEPTRYRICDPAGHLVALHVRLDEPNGKRMWWERGGRKGLGGLKVVDLPLYRAETVADSPGVVIVTEGEKAADTLAAHGLTVVATVCGASTTPSTEVLCILKDRDVVLWADHDEPGRLHMMRIAERLRGIAATVRMFSWPHEPEHGDAADFFESGGTASDVRAMLAHSVAVEEVPVSAPAPAPPKPDKRQGALHTLADPQPWPEAVDGSALLDELVAVIRSYIIMPESFAHAAVLWIVMTYMLDYVPFAVRLIAKSPTRECGKTRLLTVLAALTRRALSASSITPAALFRLIEAHAPTLMLDEMDNARLRENDEMRALLNSGHSRSTANVFRTVGDNHEPRAFSTWCAIALAAIGDLPDTITSRAIVIELQRKPRGATVARLRETRLLDEVAPLRRRLARWAADHGSAIGERDPDLPRALDGRAADNASVLVAIGDEAGGVWPERARRAILSLAGVFSDEVPGVLLLQDLRDLFIERDTDRLTTEDILHSLVKLDSRPWPEWSHGKPLTARGLARLLKPFGIEPRSVKWSDGTTRKGYVLGWFDDAFARYLPFASGTPAPAAVDAGETHFSDPAPDWAVPDTKSASDPHEQRPVPECRIETPESGGNDLVDPFDLPAGEVTP